MGYKPFKKISDRFISLYGTERFIQIFLIELVLLILFFNISDTSLDLTVYPLLMRAFSLGRMVLLVLVLLNSFVLCGDRTIKELIIMLLIGGCLFISSLKAHDKTLLFSFIVIVAAQQIPFKRIAKVYLYTYIAICVFVISLFFCGYLPDYLMERTDMIRHSLGFNHPNLLGRLIFIIQLTFVLSYPEKRNSIVFYVVSVAAAAFVWMVPNSRTSVLCIVLTMIASALSVSKAIDSKLSRLIIYGIPGFLAALSIVCVPLYDQSIRLFSIINKAFTGRLALSATIYQMAGWGGIWGNNAYWTNIPIDNCYDKLILFFGLVATVLFLLCYYASIARCIKYRKYYIALYLVVFSVYGVFEIHTFYIMYNICLFALTADITHNDLISNRNAPISSDMCH